MTPMDEISVQDELETQLDEIGSLIPSTDKQPENRSHPWGYIVIGMSVTLLAMALGGVLGYLIRPILDPPTTVEPVAAVANEPLPVKAPDVASETEGSEQTTEADALPDNTSPTPTIMDFVLSDARHFKGSPDSPVTIVEFSDFACPFCSRFSIETLPQLKTEYINTGKVRFIFKHFAVLGPMSIRAAEASECAAEQDKFWEYHDQVFGNQASVRGASGDDPLTNLAEATGLDMALFTECLAAGRYTQQIQRESQAVQSLGVRGTPGFLVNGVFISGAQPYEVFQQVVEEQLAEGE